MHTAGWNRNRRRNADLPRLLLSRRQSATVGARFRHGSCWEIEILRLCWINPGRRGIAQVGPLETGSIDDGIRQRRTAKIRACEVGILQDCPGQIGIDQIGFRQITSSQIGPLQTGPFQLRILQAGPGEIDFRRIGLRQVRPAEVGLLEYAAPKIALAECRSVEQDSRHIAIGDRRNSVIPNPGNREVGVCAAAIDEPGNRDISALRLFQTHGRQNSQRRIRQSCITQVGAVQLCGIQEEIREVGSTKIGTRQVIRERLVILPISSAAPGNQILDALSTTGFQQRSQHVVRRLEEEEEIVLFHDLNRGFLLLELPGFQSSRRRRTRSKRHQDIDVSGEGLRHPTPTGFDPRFHILPVNAPGLN